jgi:hypothetical protein
MLLESRHLECNCPRLALRACGLCGAHDHTSGNCRFGVNIVNKTLIVAAVPPPERYAEDETSDELPTLVIIPRGDKPLRAMMKALGIPTQRRTDHNYDAVKVWCQEQNIPFRDAT